MEIYFHTMPGLAEHLQDFTALYRMQKFILSPDKEPSLKPEQERRCRFCYKKYPQVRFTKKAHTIPQFLGNKFHLSDFECDTCNSMFSSCESELKNFLGILPTLSRTKGKKGIPNFHSPKDILIARKSEKPLVKGSIEILKKEVNSDAIDFKTESGYQSITYQKPPYTPFNVYKALLKIAISCLPDDEATNYCGASKIFSSANSSGFAAHAKVQKITLSFNNRKGVPAGFLFKKRDPFLKIHTHSFALYYQNIILQFPIPFHKDDGFIYRSENLWVPHCPPLFISETENDLQLNSTEIDLSPTLKKVDDYETWNMAVNKEDWKNAVRLNPETGEWEEGDATVMEDPIGIILVPHDYIVPLDESKKKKN